MAKRQYVFTSMTMEVHEACTWVYQVEVHLQNRVLYKKAVSINTSRAFRSAYHRSTTQRFAI